MIAELFKKIFGMSESVLIDADYNRQIADISNLTDNSRKSKLLKQLTKKINDRASKGYYSIKFDILDDKLPDKIANEFSRKEIYEYLKERGYAVKFRYEHLNDSLIEEISWQK